MRVKNCSEKTADSCIGERMKRSSAFKWRAELLWSKYHGDHVSRISRFEIHRGRNWGGYRVSRTKGHIGGRVRMRARSRGHVVSNAFANCTSVSTPLIRLDGNARTYGTFRPYNRAARAVSRRDRCREPTRARSTFCRPQNREQITKQLTHF